MKKYIIAAFAFATLMAGSITFTACEDIDEVKELNLDRLLSPTNLIAVTRNKVNIEVKWDEVSDAQAYTLELFKEDPDFAGNAISVVEVKQPSYTFAQLEGETIYYIRIKSTADGHNDSKWSSISRTTESEQIFQPVANEDVTYSSVTLRWPAGEQATTIILTPSDVAPHAVTAEEIQAGAATIEGLTPDCSYTAVLKNGEKTRGIIDFRTLIDPSQAQIVTPEDFHEKVGAAESGAEFILASGTYNIGGTFDVTKSITLKALDPSNRPVLIGGKFELKGGASLSMHQLIVDGTGISDVQAFDYKEEGTYDLLELEDCEIRNYDKKGVFYINVAAIVNTITINNCVIHDMEVTGSELFDCRKGAIKELNITNSTIYNCCKGREFIRYDDASSSFTSISPVITVANCTIDGVSNASGKRLLYIRFAGNSIIFKNNLISNTIGLFTNQSSTGIPTFDNNNYFNATNLQNPEGGSKFIDSNGTSVDPGYANAGAGNFTVSNADIKDYKIGDPRWIK